MKKSLRFNSILCFFLSFELNILAAQTSTVTATIQDSFNQVWANGSIGYSIYGSGVYNWHGAPLPSSYYSVTTLTLDSSGHATFTVPMTSSISPVGSLWKIIACPNATANCITAYIPINGNNVDISNALNSLIPVVSIPIQTMPKAYNDAEIIATVSQGGIYYNTGNITPGLRYWTGNVFQPVSSGGGGSGVTSINGNTGVFQFTGSVVCTGGAPVVCNFAGGTGTVTSVTNSDGTITISNPTTSATLALNLSHSNTWLAPQIFSDGANNLISIKNGVDGIGSYFSASGGQTGEIQFNASGLNIISSPKAIFFSNDSTLAQGFAFNMNTAGTPASVSISPLDSTKYLNLASTTVGIYTSHIVFNGAQATHLATDNTAPVDISNNGHGAKINLISAAVLGTDSTGKIIVGSGGGGGLSGLTATFLPVANSGTTVINSKFIDDATTGQYTGTGGFKVTGGASGIATGTTANTDIAGKLTLSGGTVAYSFAHTYTNAPFCVSTDTTALNSTQVTITNTTLTIHGTGTDVVYYICIGAN